MKAITITKFGTEESLKPSECPTPIPKKNEIQINIKYSSVNPVDWKIRKGMLSHMLPHEFPLILGWDAAGIVSDVGSDVTRFKKGDRVYAYCRKPAVHDGTYAEYICIDENNAAFSPDNLSDAQAAAIPLVGLTAWQALFDKGKLKKGETIFIQGGAGGVGSLAVELAKQKGAKVITTASKKNHPYLKSLGADHIIDYNSENIRDAFLQICPQGCDMLLDCVGENTLFDSLSLVKKNGRVVSIVNKLYDEELKGKNLTFSFVFVSPNGEQLQNITTLLENKQIQPPHIEEMDWSQVEEAHTKNQKGHTRGKIVLKIS